MAMIGKSALPGSRTQGRRRRLHGDHLSGYLFVTPQLLGYLVFVLGPLIAVFWFSLNDFNALRRTFSFVGAANYESILADPIFAEGVRNTAVFSAALVPLNLGLAMLLAVLLNQKLRGTVAFRTLFFSPVVISLAAWAIVWRFLLEADGGVNALVQLFGADGPNWLREPETAMVSVVAVQVFKNVGLNMVLFLAALQGVPEELYEAARIDGAGRWSMFRRVTLPLVSPVVLFVSILTVAGSLQVFAQILLLTEGGPGNSTLVLVYYLYKQAFQFSELGYASALAVILFLVALLLTIGQWQLRKRWVFHEI